MTDDETAEGRSILAFTAHEILGTRHQAGEKLLQSLADLDQATQVRIERLQGSDGGIGVSVLGSPAVVLVIASGGDIMICDRDRRPVRHHIFGLRYNPATKALEGTERDDAVVPTPGQQWPRRSAVSVVLEAIAEELIKQTRPPERPLGDLKLR